MERVQHMKKNSRQRPARRPVIETLEPRILFSADFVPAVASDFQHDGAAEQRTLAATGEFGHVTTQDAQSRRHELVIVDANTPDYRKLVDDINQQGGADRSIEVVVLDANKDGIGQITDILAQRKDLAAVHLISHGADGEVQLGSNVLDFATLLQNAAQIKAWGKAFAAQGDLLIYGCDVAEHADGKALVDALARLTGADVAASDDRTGAQELGGDWNLEYTDGRIEARVAVSPEERAAWQHVLASPTATNDTYSVSEDSTLVVAPSTANLANWWKLDDGSPSQSAADSGTNGNTGTLGSTPGADANDPTWSVGRVGTSALTFNGTSNYLTTTSTVAKTANSFTLSAWFQTNSTTGQHMLLWEGYAGGNGYGNPGNLSTTSEMSLSVGTYNQNNNITFHMGYDVPANGGDPIYIVSAAFTDTSRWHHAAVTVSDLGGGTFGASLYVDGVLQGTDTGVQNDRSVWGALKVGAPGAATRFFGGSVDDVRVYDTALSAAEVQSLATAGILQNDTDPNQAGLTAVLVASPSNGTLSLNGEGSFVYVPNANFFGTDTFRYFATDGTNSSNTATVTITVNPVNDAPVASGSATLGAVLEDTASPAGVQITSGLFSGNYSDATDGAQATALSGVAITANAATAGQGSWQYSANGSTWSNVPTGGLSDTAALVLPGSYYLRFVPAANYNGTPGGLTVRLSDASAGAVAFSASSDISAAVGGTGNWSAAAITLGTSVTAVNDAPVGANRTVTTNEDTAYTFATADFGFSDPNDTPANNLTAVKITTLPGAGSLTVSGVAVTAGQSVSVANINAGNLKFTPAANANGAGYASFTFQVQDDGGVANGGVDTDPTPRTMTVNVTAVNDAPVGIASAVTTNEDTPYAFSAGDFGFSDPNDAPANALNRVRITTLPGSGTLTLNGTAVNAGDFVTLAQLGGGQLVYAPAANANGAALTSFTFQVEDDGGTANGGVALDPTPRVMTVNVNAVNDAPSNTTPASLTVTEDVPDALTGISFADVDAGVSPLQVTFSVGSGTLAAAAGGGVTVSGSGTGTLTLTGSTANLNAYVAGSAVTFTTAPNATAPVTLTVTTSDQGNSGAGGPLTATSNVTINVTPVDDAPVLANNTITVVQGTGVLLAPAQLGATDIDTAAGSLVFTVSNVQAGRFELVSAPGTAVTTFTQADINSGLVRFVQNGSATAPAYDVSVTDGTTTIGPVAGTVTFTLAPGPVASGAIPGGATDKQKQPEKAPPLEILPAVVATITQPARPAAPPPLPLSPGRPDVAFADLTAQTVQLKPLDKRPLPKLVQPVLSFNNYEAPPPVDPMLLLFNYAPPTVDYQPSRPTDWAVAQAFDQNFQDQAQEQLQLMLDSVKFGGMALSVGVVWWASRVSAMLGSLLASTPAWRHIDPLPVLNDREKDRERWLEPDDRDVDANELAVALVLEGGARSRSDA
jgi:VCBS repeat-containing protein